MARSPRVTIGVPAHESASFIEETLARARAQTYEDIAILISVDESRDETESICRDIAAGDPRVSVVAQPDRLGWVGNVNRVLDLVDTDLYSLLLDDDHLEATYVERLVALLDGTPGAVNAYCDIQLFDGSDALFSTDIPGKTRFRRLLSFLSDAPSGIPFRGVTRATVPTAGVRVRPNPFNGFYAGTVYVLELLGQGECVRLAEPLYRKWVRADSVHESEWRRLPRDRQLMAWAEHSAACLRALYSMDLEPREHHALTLAVLARQYRALRPGGELHAAKVDAFAEEWLLLAFLLNNILGCAPLDEDGVDFLHRDDDVRRTIARMQYAEGIERRQAGHLPAAADALEGAMKLDPLDAEAPLQLGATYCELDRIDAGLAATVRAQALDTDDPRIPHMLSILLHRASDLPGARAAAERALQLDPGRPETTEHLARIHAEGDE